MSFEQVHQPFFNVISVFGNAPIRCNKHGHFERCVAKTYYSLFVTCAIGGYFAYVVLSHLVASFQEQHTNGIILLAIVLIREFTACIMFIYIMLQCVAVARDHANFLNHLGDLNQRISAYLLRFDSNHCQWSKHRSDSNWVAAALVTWQLSVNVSIITVYEQLNMAAMMLWMASMKYCIVLYARMLLIEVTRQLCRLRMGFSRNSASLLTSDWVVLDAVASAKETLEQVFGNIILMNLFYDLTLMLVTVFWWIYTVMNGYPHLYYNMFFVWGGSILPFWMKLFLLPFSTERFAAEVSVVSMCGL